ncbi:MAG TPA: hypothetical protein DCY74_00970, partial [Clostridiales bacterium]|nr:hypothetical protein [Clostridiales bacterium]
DHSELTTDQLSVVQSYCDFLVRYEELLYDPELKDVTTTHIGGDNTEYRHLQRDWSPDGQPGKLWLTIREKENLKVIQLINLCGISDDLWNTGKENPIAQKKIKFHVQIDYRPEGVFIASPDTDCAVHEVKFNLFRTERGMAIEFLINKVEWWNLIYIKLKRDTFR